MKYEARNAIYSLSNAHSAMFFSFEPGCVACFNPRPGRPDSRQHNDYLWQRFLRFRAPPKAAATGHWRKKGADKPRIRR